jgi:hypothetical protein
MAIHHMFPLMEVPFDAYCLLLDSYSKQLEQFVPSTMEDDLKSGKLNAMVYWYPRLVLKLYNFAYEGLDFRGYLDVLNPQNVYLFEEIFKETVKKLDKLREKRFNNNHLDEIQVKNGKLI